MNELKEYIYKLPKAELHVHIEGTMEPEQLMLFAKRNNVAVPYKTIQEAQEAYKFSDTISFINAYIQATKVLCTEQDFYDLTLAYLKKVFSQGVLHTEVFFDLQTYTARNMQPNIIINGIYRALCDGYTLFGISGAMIICIRRDLSQDDAIKTLEITEPFKDKIIAIGLASFPEEENPPDKFEKVFALARSQGYHIVAHAGECSVKTIRDTIELLHAERIDHGIYIMQDPNVVELLRKKHTALTVCPLSNVALGVVKNLKIYPLKSMLDVGLIVTINSDDPSFFHGYIADNYYAAITVMGLTIQDLITCARNSFNFSFASDERKQECLKLLEVYSKDLPEYCE